MRLKQAKKAEQLPLIAQQLGVELSYTKVVVICKIKNSNTAIDFENQTKSGAETKVQNMFPKARIIRSIGFCKMISF